MTTIVVISSIALIGLADLFLLWRGGFQNTISWWIWTKSVQYPIIPLLFGILMGHFFWDQSLNVNVTSGCAK